MYTPYIFIILFIIIAIPIIVNFIKCKIKNKTWELIPSLNDSFIYGICPAIILSIILITIHITNTVNTNSIRDTNYTILKSNEIVASTPNNDFYIDYDGNLYAGGDIYISASFNEKKEEDEKLLFCVLKSSDGKLITDFGVEESEDFSCSWSDNLPDNLSPGTYYIYVCGDKDIGKKEIEIE